MADRTPAQRAAYIRKWDGHLNRHLGPRVDVAGKRILVIGSGQGTEVLWALRNGAAEVVGIDPRPCSDEPLRFALDELGLSSRAADFRLVAATVDRAGDIGVFDHAISNNVFEHVHGVAHTLAAIAPLLPKPGGRITIFADPLYWSSGGHHLKTVDAWEHLTLSPAELQARVPPARWDGYRKGLNGMTITDFLCAVRDAGLVLLDLAVLADQRLDRFRAELPPVLKPMDLCLEGFACTLAFPHNL